MKPFFRRALVFADLHLGRKNNSELHNQDCWNFTQWMCDQAQAHDCDTCIFLGDYHNNRNSINVSTLNWSLKCLEHTAQHFEKTVLIPGNHDLYYRDRRDAYSVSWARNISGVQIISDITSTGDCVFVPWLVTGEHGQLQQCAGQYMFAHLELPNFIMNSQIRMPDLGHNSVQDLQGLGQVFSGHFHRRQQQQNVSYTGSCFPLDFSDAGDDQRGIMILPWGQEPEYINWTAAPRYRVHLLSSIIENPDLLIAGSYVRAMVDLELTYEQSQHTREQLQQLFGLRELQLIPQRQDLAAAGTTELDPSLQSVDQIVSSQLSVIQSDVFDSQLLLNIYNNL